MCFSAFPFFHFRPFFIVLLSLLLITAASVRAQDIEACQNVQNTAEVMACLKTGYDKEQKRLAHIFERLSAQIDSRSKIIAARKAGVPIPSVKPLKQGKIASFGLSSENLRATQKKWLEYRDAQCRWGANQAVNESARRMEELSCLILLTQQRSEVLVQFLAGNESDLIAQRYSMLPRWMNAVAAEKPDVFWRYADHIEGDMDCDGQVEEIMTGMRLKPVNTGAGKTGVDDAEILIAITDNPITGRAQTHFQTLAVAEGGDTDLCSADVTLSYSPHTAGNDTSKKSTCSSYVALENISCPSLYLYKKRGLYVISNQKPPFT